jgi:hypothetical protein
MSSKTYDIENLKLCAENLHSLYKSHFTPSLVQLRVNQIQVIQKIDLFSNNRMILSNQDDDLIELLNDWFSEFLFVKEYYNFIYSGEMSNEYYDLLIKDRFGKIINHVHPTIDNSFDSKFPKPYTHHLSCISFAFFTDIVTVADGSISFKNDQDAPRKKLILKKQLQNNKLEIKNWKIICSNLDSDHIEIVANLKILNSLLEKVQSKLYEATDAPDSWKYTANNALYPNELLVIPGMYFNSNKSTSLKTLKRNDIGYEYPSFAPFASKVSSNSKVTATTAATVVTAIAKNNATAKKKPAVASTSEDKNNLPTKENPQISSNSQPLTTVSLPLINSSLEKDVDKKVVTIIVPDSYRRAASEISSAALTSDLKVEPTVTNNESSSSSTHINDVVIGCAFESENSAAAAVAEVISSSADAKTESSK